MTTKLGIGQAFPKLSIHLVDGAVMELPRELGAKYGVILFYRGHWCPFCRRTLAGFQKLKPELDALDVNIFAASVDPIEKASDVAKELSFRVGYGVTHAMAEQLGSWWDARRNFMQPSEFIVDSAGTIIASSYSDGPLGRMDAADVVRFIQFREAQMRK